MPSDLAIWIGVVIAGIGAITGGYVFVTNQISEAKKDADAKLGAAITAINTRISECFSAAEGVRKEADERTNDLRQEFSDVLGQERDDRRRDVDRIERAVESFGRVSESVAAMGRSVEHLTGQLASHRADQERQMGAVQSSIQKVSERLAELRSFKPQ